MGDRKSFDTKSEDFAITKHPDGSLTIEAEAYYGDSYNGWGETHTTLHLDHGRVIELQKFLLDQ